MTKMQRERERDGGGRVHGFIKGMKRRGSAHTNAKHTTLAGHCTIARSLKYSCSRACLAVILLLGSYRSIFCQKTEIGELNAVKLFEATVMIINRNHIRLTERRSKPAGSRFGTIVARSCANISGMG
jgi:hypothetical protein